MTASKLENLNSWCINEAYVPPTLIFLSWVAKHNPITVLRNISTLPFFLFLFFCLFTSQGRQMCVFVYFFFFALPFSPSLPSLVSFLSLGVYYFSPVIRHADSSLSPSNTTRINFPALSHVGGPQSGTHLYMHFIHPHICWNTRTGTYDTHTHAGWWFTTLLFSNVLLAPSLQHPFVFADRSWQQHLSIHTFSLPPSRRYFQLRPPTQPPRPAELTLVFSVFWKKKKKKTWNFFACEWLLFWCGVLEVCQTLCTRAAKHWSVISVGEDSMWWIVKEDSAQDGVWWRIT